ncbi:MAG: glycosyltransferase family 39 protein [Actinobacteria bacterium]|nr:glycosyltransferase family 39 protein [Actinomycetota bacterium]
MIVLRALSLALIIFIPGWLGVSLCDRGENTLDNGERLYLAFALGTGILSLWALVLALFSAYNLVALLLAWGLTSIALALAARRRAGRLKRLKARDLSLALAIVVIALVLFAPPWRIVFGWSDVGVYANIAAHIEEEGELSVENRVASEVQEERRDLLYYQEEKRTASPVYFENQFYLIDDFDSGTMRPWFYYLWPSLMAAFASFLGVSAQYWAITIVALLALWGFFLLARRLLGARWAIAAAVLFALSPLVMYFAHYTTSEMMNIFLFISAALCLLAYLQAGGRAGGRGLAVLAAFFFTLGFLCRVDFIFVLAPIALCYLARQLSGGTTSDDRWFLALLSAGAALSVLAGLLFSRVYFQSVWKSFLGSPSWVLLLGILLAAAVLMAIICGKRLEKLVRKLTGARSIWVPAVWVVLCGIFVYLYFIRPLGAEEIVGYGFIKEITGPSYMDQNLVRWAWYLSFAGVAAVFAGYGTWFTRRRGFGEHTLGFIGFAYLLFYAWNMRAMPMHILVMRRLVPVVFAMAVMAIIYGLESLVDIAGFFEIGGRPLLARRISSILALGFVLYLLFFSVNASIPIFGLNESGNQVELCEEIAADVEDGGTLIMDYNLGDLFGSPLRSMYGVENAWLKDNSILGEEDFLHLLADFGFEERPIYLLWRPQASGDHIGLVEPLRAELVSEYRFQEESLEKSFEHRPSRRTVLNEELLLLLIQNGDESRM